MRRWIAWFARNPVAANLLLGVIAVGGLVSAMGLRQEIWPEVSFDRVLVTTPYPGAAPEEVEESICIKIEEEILDLDGIKHIRSTAGENVGVVVVEVESGHDAGELADDIKARVDMIDSFPEEAEDPVVEEIVVRNLVVNLAIWGDADELTLRRLGERVRNEILEIPGITQAVLMNARPFEISIEVSEETLRKYGLTFDDVAGAVRRSSLDLPGGSVKTSGGEILLRAEGQAYTGREFGDLVLLTRDDGTKLTIGDVATVRDGFEDIDRSATFNGKPCVTVWVLKVGDQNVPDIARKVKD
jgi:multidrug efflux pump subunit AcrB